MATLTLDVEAVRKRFGALQRHLALLDGPGGTQVPDEVIDAISAYLRESNANVGGPFETSMRTVHVVDSAREAAGRFLGCSPHEVTFGANMTSLSFALSRTAGRGFEAGDEIVVTRLDHDGNVAPWLELAHDLGLEVRFADITDDCDVDLADLERQLSSRTRVVAFPVASNAVGTLTQVARIAELAHGAGFCSLVFNQARGYLRSGLARRHQRVFTAIATSLRRLARPRDRVAVAITAALPASPLLLSLARQVTTIPDSGIAGAAWRTRHE